jgi:hypothetical protein
MPASSPVVIEKPPASSRRRRATPQPPAAKSLFINASTELVRSTTSDAYSTFFDLIALTDPAKLAADGSFSEIDLSSNSTMSYPSRSAIRPHRLGDLAVQLARQRRLEQVRLLLEQLLLGLQVGLQRLALDRQLDAALLLLIGQRLRAQR